MRQPASMSAVVHVPHRPMRCRLTNALKHLLIIVCLCSACTRIAVHTYRHFHPHPAVVIGP